MTIATTDVESGDTILFDSARGDRIGIEHLMLVIGGSTALHRLSKNATNAVETVSDRARIVREA